MAGASPKPEEGKKKARIEIIPLIDVIFFLLATFVLFTLSLEHIVSVPVQLPVASDNPGRPDETMVTLQVSEGGTCYWNREPIGYSEIPPRLENYKKTVANPRILVAGDSKAKFGSCVLVLDAVRKAGIDQLSVETLVTPTGK